MKFSLLSLFGAKNHWLYLGFVLFCCAITVGIFLVSILNTGYFNHLTTPINNYLPMIEMLWHDSLLNAMQFASTKSLIAFAYLDPRSQLNLWTYEFDTISLSVYFLTSIYLTWNLKSYPGMESIPASIGSGLIILSISYMSVIKHCAGPTWVGFVAAYGLGFQGFEHWVIWQWLLAVSGIALILYPKFRKIIDKYQAK